MSNVFIVHPHLPIGMRMRRLVGFVVQKKIFHEDGLFLGP